MWKDGWNFLPLLLPPPPSSSSSPPPPPSPELEGPKNSPPTPKRGKGRRDEGEEGGDFVGELLFLLGWAAARN